ncbi:hypothetical protein [Acinetobacter beijerinckii]|uniref:hypothetical protein n=1 Tax=Acinetobacter beijerinckii TaxID=262668 RepID=UPI00300BC449
MNAAVNHIMQTVDWTRFSLEEWLYQFGAWMHSNSGTCGKSINPIAVAMDQAVKKRKQQIKGKDQIIADWIGSLDSFPQKRGKPTTCEITDNEARAVQRLILDMQGKSHVLDEWLDAVIDRYFYGNSWPNMVIKVGRVDNPTILRSEMDARSDVKCGLAALHSRYGFIKYK